jgi:CPA2 family monovalent cation:H+ antiporter-2
MIGASGGVGGVLIELGGVVLALAVLGRVAARFDLPSIPLYLLAGLLAGEGGFIPLDASRDFIAIGAEVGVVLLLLLLGLEYSTQELNEGLRSGWRGGVLDIVLNMTPGVLAGFVLGWDWLPALLLGGITYISSSGIIAKLLSDLDRLGNRETPTILSLLVMEDLAMAVFLPIIAVLLIGGSPVDGAVSILIAVSAVVLAFTLSARWGHHVSKAVSSRSNELLLLTILGLTFLVAGLAEELQISAAIGAFLIGVTLSGKVAEEGRELLMPLRDVFGGLFFVFFGLRVDPGTLPPMVLPALVLAIVTAATKWATGWSAAGKAGIATRGRMRAGLSLVPRGEFSIVIAGIGVAAGVEDDLGPLTAAYVLILAVVGSLGMRYADRIPALRT